MLQLDRNTLEYFMHKGSEKIKIFFYSAGCSGTKLNISDDFEMDQSLHFVRNEEGVDIYIDKRDKEKFKNCSITRVVKADHTGKEKVRYIYASGEVSGRCGCGSSFSFDEVKMPRVDLEKLKKLKEQMK